MDNIIFRDSYVNYNQISNVSLMQIHDVLLDNNIMIELGDDFYNDWAGYSYYYCKNLNKLDEKAISSFVYIITWFMTGNPIEINPNFKSSKYFKNDKIISKCLELYDKLCILTTDEVNIASQLVILIHEFYVTNYEKFLKRSERISTILTYKEKELLNMINGESYGDKINNLLIYYYKE